MSSGFTPFLAIPTILAESRIPAKRVRGGRLFTCLAFFDYTPRMRALMSGSNCISYRTKERQNVGLCPTAHYQASDADHLFGEAVLVLDGCAGSGYISIEIELIWRKSL